MIFSRGKKNPCAPTCPPLWMIFPINIRYLPNNNQNLAWCFVLYERNRNFRIFDPLKAEFCKCTLNGSTFSIFLVPLASKLLKLIRIFSWEIALVYTLLDHIKLNFHPSNLWSQKPFCQGSQNAYFQV